MPLPESVEVALCAQGVPEEVTINLKSMKSLGNTNFQATALPHGAAGRAPAPSESIEGSFGEPYQTNGFLKAPLQRHCGCLSAYAVGRCQESLSK